MKNQKKMTIDGLATISIGILEEQDVDDLLLLNSHNRNLNSARVKQIEQEIKFGNYVFNGATIVVDSLGVLRDGQTRLHALKNCKCPDVYSLVVFLHCANEDADRIQFTMDKGQKRQYHQQLMMQGVGGYRLIAPLRRSILIYVENRLNRTLISDFELDLVGKEYEMEISQLVEFTNIKKHCFIIRLPTIFVAVCCALAKKYNCIEKIKDACRRISTMSELVPGTTLHSTAQYLSRISGCTVMDRIDVYGKCESIVMSIVNGIEISKIYPRLKEFAKDK